MVYRDQGRSQMTDNMMREVANAPVGTYKIYNGSDIGHDSDSIHTHLANLQGIGERIQVAFDGGFFIEALSLRLQIIDFWLRVYYRNKRSDGERRHRGFGRLIEQCENLGFDSNLSTKLMDFNRHRINAIHGYVMGKTTYETLGPMVKDSRTLSADTISWVLQNCGEVITDMEGKTFRVGDMVLDWKSAIAQL